MGGREGGRSGGWIERGVEGFLYALPNGVQQFSCRLACDLAPSDVRLHSTFQSFNFSNCEFKNLQL